MELLQPYAVYSKSDPQTPEANKDYSMTAPLSDSGSDYPAKKRCTSEILSALSPVATLVSGEDFEWKLGGTATHTGGSCQIGITYDNCATIAVIASYIGGCPLSMPYKFKVPDLPGADKAFFVWAWSNRSGNRELYQNVAVVAVKGSASEFKGPTMFRANTFGGSCINPEGTDVVYPAPGDQVFYGGDYSESSPPTAAKLDCPDYDNSAIVTVKNSGGGSGPSEDAPAGESTPKSDANSPKSDSKPTETKTGGDKGGTASSSSSSSGSSGSSGGGGGTGSASSTKPAATQTATSSTGSGTDDNADAGSGSGAEAASSANGSSTGSTPTTSSTLSDANKANFAKFAIGGLALLIVAGIVIFVLRRKGTSGSRCTSPEDPSDDSGESSDDSYRDEKPSHRHSRRHGHH
ncbi:uncharacterized protein JCM15063_000093 [Sporobolomyces koalae]|uniref:uncharacterized protein n=1 Tax=Sporobolomyces koalae TaxID=500713 RepID=UPI0031754262